ncbi:MAG: hypothetical protein ACJ765_03750 [Chloroflexota bacterium]
MPVARRPAAMFAAIALLAAACGPTTSSVTAPSVVATRPPSAPASTGAMATPPIPGLSWVKARNVERPTDAFAEASGNPTAPSGPGTAGHPGHFPGQAVVDDVSAVGDGLIAVGYVGVNGVWTAIGWGSTDGQRWTLEPIDEAPASFAVAVAAATGRLDGRSYAAGRSGPLPVVWEDVGNGSWHRTQLPTLSLGAEWERVVAIASTDGGLLAGGSAGPELGDRRARFWSSPDGAAWEAAPDDEAFAGAEVVAIDPRPGGGYVAAGRLGTGQRSTGSVAWLSDDGATWRRVDDPSLGGGLVNALATDADGSIVAVGSDPDEREALVWRSPDGGATWERAPREASRLYEPYKIRMTDVVPTPGGLVAVGNYVGLQYGTATSWVARDWTSWTRAPSYPALGQGEMLAAAPGGPGLVSVGSFGAPDNYVPTIWLSDLPGG